LPLDAVNASRQRRAGRQWEDARMRSLKRVLGAGFAAVLLLWGAPPAPAAEPIKIGFSMELTGPFAVVGKTGLLAFKIWEEEINA
jgi:branched-chain amino acid transport system substrate-binding protein